jgi:tetratricopeptide (TPR) repeat protein
MQHKHYDEAERFFSKAYYLSKAIYGNEDQKTLNCMNSIANSLKMQCKFNEAEEMYKEVLQIQQKLFGDKNVYSILTMRELGNVYFLAGDSFQAEIWLLLG